MEYKNNVFTLNTKSKVPDTITISFNNSEAYTYTLSSSDNIDFTGAYTTMATMNSNSPSEIDLTTSQLEFHDDNNF
jgi:hypothetical protein